MTKMVQLSDEAYRKLKMAKRRGESFSDVVLRVMGRKRSLRELADLGRTNEEIEDHIRLLREVGALDRPELTRWPSSTRRS
ncbi:MAG: hypothetical protein KY455_11900 [Euryarchaeota archaeon]|nr:hypothetical protein [Euryarchaeota archaeon]